jgi:hypothetical protein
MTPIAWSTPTREPTADYTHNADSRSGLDPPLTLYFPRLVWRTLLRLLRLRAPCSPGCPEILRELFTWDGIVVWCLTNHSKCRARFREQLAAEQRAAHGNGVRCRMRRIGGWGAEVREWVAAVRRMAQRADVLLLG